MNQRFLPFFFIHPCCWGDDGDEEELGEFIPGESRCREARVNLLFQTRKKEEDERETFRKPPRHFCLAWKMNLPLHYTHLSLIFVQYQIKGLSGDGNLPRGS